MSEQFVGAAGVGGNAGSFARRAAGGVYAVVLGLVGNGVEPSQPLTFLFQVGNVTSTAFDAAVQSFFASPLVSVFNVVTPLERGAAAPGG